MDGSPISAELTAIVLARASRTRSTWRRIPGCALAILSGCPGRTSVSDAIVLRTGKSRQRREAIIPLYDELRVMLDRIPEFATTC